MTRYTQRQLKDMVARGIAINVTDASSREAIPEHYRQIGYAQGIYGCNGMLLQGASGQLYAVIARTSAIYVF